MTKLWPFQTSLTVFCLLGLAISLTGCGSETYEKRLANTVEYYKYLERVQKALAPGAFEEQNLRFQPPKGFELIPKDKKDKDRDTRLPEFLRSEIPGVVGVWKMNVPVMLGQESVEKPVYMLALSNADRWAKSRTPGAPDPLKYHNDLFYTLLGEVGISDITRADRGPNLDLNVWKSGVTFPDSAKDTKFAPPKTYNTITLFNPEMRFDNIPMEFNVYQYGAGDNQAALLIISPRNIAADSYRENLKMALPTFDYTRPAAASAPPAGNSAPGTTSPGASNTPSPSRAPGGGF
jgi:hypothetical protein